MCEGYFQLFREYFISAYERKLAQNMAVRKFDSLKGTGQDPSEIRFKLHVDGTKLYNVEDIEVTYHRSIHRLRISNSYKKRYQALVEKHGTLIFTHKKDRRQRWIHHWNGSHVVRWIRR
jgi:hypothetical protein